MTEELCGDRPLSASDRLRYVWRNALQNFSGIGRGFASRSFHPDADLAKSLIGGQSPGRLLSELFIAQELPSLLPPGRIRILEIGCGSGSMVRRLSRLGYSGDYLGIDVQDRFRAPDEPDFPFAAKFIQVDAHDMQVSEQVDLIISVSALEHIPNDAAVIHRIRSFMKPGGIELHIVPSGASLAVYLLHGYRQYTPASIAQRFGARTETIRLGGLASFLAHFFVITVPDLVLGRSLRKASPDAYARLILSTLHMDRYLPVCPTAYAVIRRH